MMTKRTIALVLLALGSVSAATERPELSALLERYYEAPDRWPAAREPGFREVLGVLRSSPELRSQPPSQAAGALERELELPEGSGLVVLDVTLRSAELLHRIRDLKVEIPVQERREVADRLLRAYGASDGRREIALMLAELYSYAHLNPVPERIVEALKPISEPWVAGQDLIQLLPFENEGLAFCQEIANRVGDHPFLLVTWLRGRSLSPLLVTASYLAGLELLEKAHASGEGVPSLARLYFAQEAFITLQEVGCPL